jgi:hypothetical protein
VITAWVHVIESEATATDMFARRFIVCAAVVSWVVPLAVPAHVP